MCETKDVNNIKNYLRSLFINNRINLKHPLLFIVLGIRLLRLPFNFIKFYLKRIDIVLKTQSFNVTPL